MNIHSKFVIMKHDAKKAGLHYDLRFKKPTGQYWDSYSVPKGISTEVGKKVLAIKTSKHSEHDALYTGEIKSGYGTGHLSRWDGGSCIIEKYTPQHLVIVFNGNKMKGRYHFVSVKFVNKDSERREYFLFKAKE